MKEDRKELAKRIHQKRVLDKYEKKMVFLGLSNIDIVYQFLNIRLLVSIFLFIFILLFYNWGLILAPIITGLFYYGFSYLVFDAPIRKRKMKLEREAIYFFEVLTLSLESGKNLLQAIEVTSKNVEGELSKEFEKTFKEVKYGKSFHESFHKLRKRIPSDTIDNILLNIIEANSSGIDITTTLKQQVSYIRNKRVMDMKATMNKIPIKISVVSVILFIPLIMLMVLSPVIIEYLLG